MGAGLVIGGTLRTPTVLFLAKSFLLIGQQFVIVTFNGSFEERVFCWLFKVFWLLNGTMLRLLMWG